MRKPTATLTMMALCGALAACSGERESPTAATPSATATSTSGPREREREYADGDYRATGWYGGQPSSIGVSVTLADGVITDVEVETHATNPTSLDYQQRFAGGVAEVVVGKRIDEVEVSRIAGSSTTPDGFNDAIDRIRERASR
jgi:uncharacterized protein with FMN-binding domain